MDPVKPTYSHLLPPHYKSLIASWLAEDVPSFDYGGCVVGDAPTSATLWMKSRGVVCACPFVDEIFAQVGCTVEWHVAEGTLVEPQAGASVQDGIVKLARTRIATVSGPCRFILLGERPALNLICRASGIALYARQLGALKEKRGWSGVFAATRKTTPGFRLVEKYAVLVGGCSTHRMDLSQMVMLKDNHVKASGSIPNAVALARSVCGFSCKIQVECCSYEEAHAAFESGSDLVMLDNFTGERAGETARRLKQVFGAKCLIEASGNLRIDTVEQYMSNDIDVLSLGGLTQSVHHVDYSLKLD